MTGKEKNTIQKSIDKLTVDIRAVKKLLIGNGKVGLCEEQRNHTERLARLEESQNQDHAFRKKVEKFGLIIIVALVMQTETGDVSIVSKLVDALKIAFKFMGFGG